MTKLTLKKLHKRLISNDFNKCIYELPGDGFDSFARELVVTT